MQSSPDLWGHVTYSSITTLFGKVFQQYSSYNPYEKAMAAMLKRFNLASEVEFYALPYGDLWERTRDYIEQYYIDEFIFDDDPFLKPEERNRLEQRGGNGIVTLRRQGDLLVGIRDIVLGRNIPDYGYTAPLEDTESYVFSRPGVTGSRILQQ